MSGELKPITNISYKECVPNLVPVILLHGLTSAKETWDECAHIIAHRTGAKVYSFDARNHGDSEWSEDMLYDVMAEDLRSFMDSLFIEKAIIVGHSMGGKTGMVFSLRHPERLECLIIEDISISPTSKRYIIQSYLEKLKDIPSHIPSHLELSDAKKMAADLIIGGQSSTSSTSTDRPKAWNGSDLPLRRKHEVDGFEWKMNLKGLTHFVQEGATRNYFNPGELFSGPVLVIYGTESPYNVMNDRETFLQHFPKASYVPIEGGTHSLHRDYPEIFCDLVCYFILEQRFMH